MTYVVSELNVLQISRSVGLQQLITGKKKGRTRAEYQHIKEMH